MNTQSDLDITTQFDRAFNSGTAAATQRPLQGSKLVIFGTSNILSDLFDAALAIGLVPSTIVIHLPESVGPRDRPLNDRLRPLTSFGCSVRVTVLDEFEPGVNECYVLGPTTPTRRVLAEIVERRFGIHFNNLIHPTAYVSPLATIGRGVFVGAKTVVAPGVTLEDHVFINRMASIGHDTRVGQFSRIQPGANVCSLTRIGMRTTIGAGATIIERLIIGDDVVVAAGAVVTKDVPTAVMVAGVPATIRRTLSP